MDVRLYQGPAIVAAGNFEMFTTYLEAFPAVRDEGGPSKPALPSPSITAGGLLNHGKAFTMTCLAHPDRTLGSPV